MGIAGWRLRLARLVLRTALGSQTLIVSLILALLGSRPTSR
jgi:hypothetical protein